MTITIPEKLIAMFYGMMILYYTMFVFYHGIRTVRATRRRNDTINTVWYTIVAIGALVMIWFPFFPAIKAVIGG